MDCSTIKHLVCPDQPEGIAPLSQRLFAAYQIEGGRVQLAGCTLEERALLRYGEPPSARYVDPLDGTAADADAAAMGLDAAVAIDRPGPQQAAAWSQCATAELADATAAVWCRWAEGKLRFLIGEQTAELGFAGWAKTLPPPPYLCPHSGTRSHRLAATSDGRIVAAESIGVCGQSGARVLHSELVVCAASGARLLPAYAERCPVSGDWVARDRLMACAMCGERVGPQTLDHGRCSACRGLQAIDAGEPRWQAVLARHPEIARWSRLAAAETQRVYIIAGSGWLKRRLWVIDRASGDLRRTADAARWSPGWR